MKFVQYYLDCLSQASYLIGDESSGRAVVVDPRRDVAEYVQDASEAGLTIELVIETHFHADFLSGHLELAEATGAEIAYSSVAETEFPSRKLADGERLYHKWCARCHGAGGVSSSALPDLRASVPRLTNAFEQVASLDDAALNARARDTWERLYGGALPQVTVAEH